MLLSNLFKNVVCSKLLR